jgi:K+-transporting ATPase A subunit
MGFRAVSPDSAFNPSVSFATNTNWQGYGGETTMSYLTQMLALKYLDPRLLHYARKDQSVISANG